MQQEEPFSTNGPSALDDYMAALLRDDAEPQEQFTASLQSKETLPADESSPFKDSENKPNQQSIESSVHSQSLPLVHGQPLNETDASESPIAQPALEVKIPRLAAEAIPADVALSSVQKHSLQKLLDQQMSAPTPEPPVVVYARPGVQFASDEADDAVDTDTDTELVADAPLAIEQDGAAHKSIVLPEPEGLSQDAFDTEQEPTQAIFQKSHREHWTNGLPDWGSQRFDVLLFSCRKVNLAIPLISLGHIYLERGSLTQMPGLPSWVLGVKASAAGNLKVIDAGAYFMPERAATLDAQDELHIVSLAGSQWAFAVDSVANPISMNIQDVQWRSQSPHSSWLAGAIKREMCVLIDPPALLFDLQRKRSV